MSSDASEPRGAYEARLKTHQGRAERLRRRSSLISNLRLLVFAAGIAIAWAAFGPHWLDAFWLAMPAGAFVALMIVHERTLRAQARAEGAAAFYARGLERLDDRWAGTGLSGDDLEPPEHPYAPDLDLFGKGSLFELLCLARTRAGEGTLGDWLCGPAKRDEILGRQEAVAELRPGLDLREDLALLGSDVRRGVLPEVVTKWGEAGPAFDSKVPLRTAHVLAVTSITSLVLWPFSGFGPLLFSVSIIGIWALNVVVRKRVTRVLEHMEEPGRELFVLSQVLERLEQERFVCPRLLGLQDALTEGAIRASVAIGRLYRLLQWHEARGNQLFAPFAVLLQWDIHFAYAFERWRLSYGRHVARWLRAVGEVEALSSLAAYAFEHPGDPFPEIVESGPYFDGEGLGHPLIPARVCVRNDLRMGGELRLLVVSGSNMSGKSTLLRTVGTNVVLALAGAPVRATRLTVSPMTIGATLRIQDSIHEGRSRFYAEIRKIRQLMDLASGPLPLLFLLDEILHGTNSNDRKTGADAIVRGLLEGGALGLVTTHDLALARTADELGARAANVHFEDQLEGGQLHFDYRMRTGVVQKSNALELMRAVGLRV